MILTLALPLALLLQGCGGKPSAAEGTYELDKAAFVEQGLKSLIDSGRIPAAAREIGRRQLERVSSILELKGDGTFVNFMEMSGRKHKFTGEWTQKGNRIELRQTHSDGREKEDAMSGTLDGDNLFLVHEEEGLSFPYPMRRRRAHASPK